MDWKLKISLCTELMVVMLVNCIDMAELMALEPSFDSPMANVTVKEMTTAILPCSVKFLGGHAVVWTDQWSTLLTFEDRRIIDDERLSVERPFIKDWNLHIRNVKHEDEGLYNCQLNTNPVKIKTVNLKVQVPAKIQNNASTDALIARESTTVTLVCNVSGIPMPTVTWYRLVSDEKGEGKKNIGISGEVLVIRNASRHCGGVYECIADNGVPPAVNKLIRVSVEYPPEIELPNDRIGQARDKETILECGITANPQAVGMWKKDGKELKTLSGKYRLAAYSEEDHSVTLSLSIQITDVKDYGYYTCEASNKLGKASGRMELYDHTLRRLPSTTTTTTTTTTHPTSSHLLYPPSHHHHQQQHQQPSYHDTRRPKVVKDNHMSYVTKRPNHRLAVDQSDRRASASAENRGVSIDPNFAVLIASTAFLTLTCTHLLLIDNANVRL